MSAGPAQKARHRNRIERLVGADADAAVGLALVEAVSPQAATLAPRARRRAVGLAVTGQRLRVLFEAVRGW